VHKLHKLRYITSPKTPSTADTHSNILRETCDNDMKAFTFEFCRGNLLKSDRTVVVLEKDCC
jgi:hypothetical protein